MEDVQSQPDERGITIDRVGVADLQYPIAVRTAAGAILRTVGRATLSVRLPCHTRGTHMSRMVETLHDWATEMTLASTEGMVMQLAERLDAATAGATIRFSYFMERTAPVSGLSSYAHYESWFAATKQNGTVDSVLGVEVPVTTVCPCSKAVSDYGAHNQRGRVTIEIRQRASEGPEHVDIESLIEIAENCASAPVYPLLKRSDERYLTMRAYDNPVFVEDMTRDVAARLAADERIAWFRVESVNDESIHDHGAFAAMEWSRVGDGTLGSQPAS